MQCNGTTWSSTWKSAFNAWSLTCDANFVRRPVWSPRGAHGVPFPFRLLRAAKNLAQPFAGPSPDTRVANRSQLLPAVCSRTACRGWASFAGAAVSGGPAAHCACVFWSVRARVGKRRIWVAGGWGSGRWCLSARGRFGGTGSPFQAGTERADEHELLGGPIRRCGKRRPAFNEIAGGRTDIKRAARGRHRSLSGLVTHHPCDGARC